MTKESSDCVNNSSDSNSMSENHQRGCVEEEPVGGSFASPIEETVLTNSLNMDVLPSNQVLSNSFNSLNQYADFNHETIASEIMMDFVNCSEIDENIPNYFARSMSPSSFEFSTVNENNAISLLEDMRNETCSSGYFSESYSELEYMDMVRISNSLQNDNQKPNAYDKFINESNSFEANNNLFENFQGSELQNEADIFNESIAEKVMNYVNPFAEFKGFYPKINTNEYDPKTQTTSPDNCSDKISVTNTLNEVQDFVMQNRNEHNSAVHSYENYSKYSGRLLQTADRNPNTSEITSSSEYSKTSLSCFEKELHSEIESSVKQDELLIFNRDGKENSESEESNSLEHEKFVSTSAANNDFQENPREFKIVKLVDYPLSPVYQRYSSKIPKATHFLEKAFSNQNTNTQNCQELGPIIEQNVNSTEKEIEDLHYFQNQQNAEENKPDLYTAPTCTTEVIAECKFGSIDHVGQISKTEENEKSDGTLHSKTEVLLSPSNSNTNSAKEETICNSEILLAIMKSFFLSYDSLKPHEEDNAIKTKDTRDENLSSETIHLTENNPKDISKGLTNDHNYFNCGSDIQLCSDKKCEQVFTEFNGIPSFSTNLNQTGGFINTFDKYLPVSKPSESAQCILSFDKNDKGFQKFLEGDSRFIKTDNLSAELNDKSNSLQIESSESGECQKCLPNSTNDLEMPNALRESEELLATEIVNTELSGLENANFFDELSPMVGDIFDVLKHLDNCIDFNTFDNVFSTQISTLNKPAEYQGELSGHSLRENTITQSECNNVQKQSELQFNTEEKEPALHIEGMQEESDEQLRNCICNIQQSEYSGNQKINYGSCFNLQRPKTNKRKALNQDPFFDAQNYNTSSSKNETSVEQSIIEVNNMQPCCSKFGAMKNDFQLENTVNANVNLREFQTDIKNDKKETDRGVLPNIKKGIQSIKLIVPREYHQNQQIKSLNFNMERKEKDGLCLRSYLDSGTKSTSKDGRGSVISYFSKATGLISTASPSNPKIETENVISKQNGIKIAEDSRHASSIIETRSGPENQCKPMFLHKITESTERMVETLPKVCINTTPKPQTPKPQNASQPPGKRQCLTSGFSSFNSSLLSSNTNVFRNLGGERIPSPVVEVAQIVDNYAAKFQNSTATYASPQTMEFGPKQFHTKTTKPQNMAFNTLKSGLEKRETVKRTNRRKTTVADCTLSAVQELNNGQGSTVFDIMGYVRNHIPPSNNISHDVRKTLKIASGTGNIELKSGRYMITQIETITESSKPKTTKRKLNFDNERACKVRSKKTNPTPKTQPKRTKSVRFFKKSDSKREGDPSL